MLSENFKNRLKEIAGISNNDLKINLDSNKITLDNKEIGNIYVFGRNDQYLILDKIAIYEPYRNKGYAQQAMLQLIDYANKKNLIITLTPDNVFGANENKLRKWYQSLGFVFNKGKNKDFGHMNLMYKLPNGINSLNESDITPSPISHLKVYHGTNSEFDNFDLKKSIQGIIWFTDDINSIKTGAHGGQGNKYIMTRYITLKNPAGWLEYEKYGLGQIENMGFDGIILSNRKGADYIVFKKSSIFKK